ncbi:MAG: hypothetical protein JRE40_14105 [Deltaproteobacteria bacterium]|nr:hypothetical protein [Deltaproteobacteria bacterium]
MGIITIDSIKDSFVHQENLPWVLACDMMLPVEDIFTQSTPLEQAIKQMKSCNQETLCVTEDTTNKLVGTLDLRRVNRKVSAEILLLQKSADEQILTAS